MEKRKYSAGLWIYGSVPDRYLPTGYQSTVEIEERIARVSRTQGLTGIEMPYGPVLTLENLDRIQSMVANCGLSISSIGVNVTGSQKWALGALSNPNAAVRKDAILLIQDSMQAAKELHVETVNLWLGQDGFDYPMEVDYRVLWEQIVEGLKECADSCPEIKLSLEYKRMEPRSRNIPNSAAQALLLVEKAGSKNLGVTLDFGHALLGGENPSQSALMLYRYGKLAHVHMNDNYGDWDWDMAAGFNHWWQLVEFCYWWKELNINKWLVLDIFPYRHSPEKVSELSITAIDRAFEIAENLNKDVLKHGFENHSAIEIFGKLMQ